MLKKFKKISPRELNCCSAFDATDKTCLRTAPGSSWVRRSDAELPAVPEAVSSPVSLQKQKHPPSPHCHYPRIIIMRLTLSYRQWAVPSFRLFAKIKINIVFRRRVVVSPFRRHCNSHWICQGVLHDAAFSYTACSVQKSIQYYTIYNIILGAGGLEQKLKALSMNSLTNNPFFLLGARKSTAYHDQQNKNNSLTCLSKRLPARCSIFSGTHCPPSFQILPLLVASSVSQPKRQGTWKL